MTKMRKPDPVNLGDLQTLAPGDVVTIVSDFSPYKGFPAVVTDPPEFYSPYGNDSAQWYVKVAVGEKTLPAASTHRYPLTSVRRLSDG